jgi:nitrate reductase gamma subunit
VSEQFVSVLENEVQIVALTIFGILYAVKLAWMFSLPVAKETAPPKASKATGVILSFGTLFMPWQMESTRRHWFIYTEFALFHLGIACTIAVTFIIPYAPHWLSPPVTGTFLAVITLALIMGVVRLVRRIVRPEMRAISSPDDYFCITLLDLYLASALYALAGGTSLAMVLFFGLTTFFLLYVPFSKISHYLYYPFTRYYFGAHFGRRGVLVRRSPEGGR